MAVTLFTSRVVLNALGVIDFGIYNVVGRRRSGHDGDSQWGYVCFYAKVSDL